jgi:hypothetical protein
MGYCVHIHGLPGRHARILDEPSVEAAALAWLEDSSAWLDAAGASDVTLIVRELDCGAEHCLRFDLEIR